MKNTIVANFDETELRKTITTYTGPRTVSIAEPAPLDETHAAVLSYLDEIKLSKLGEMATATGINKFKLLSAIKDLEEQKKLTIVSPVHASLNRVYFAPGEVDKIKAILINWFRDRPQSALPDLKTEIYRLYPHFVKGMLNVFVNTLVKDGQLTREQINYCYKYSCGPGNIARAKKSVINIDKTYSGFPAHVRSKLKVDHFYLSVPNDPDRTNYA